MMSLTEVRAVGVCIVIALMRARTGGHILEERDLSISCFFCDIKVLRTRCQTGINFMT